MSGKTRLNPVLKIDPEFESKIPPLTEDEYTQLEENIISEGAVLMPLMRRSHDRLISETKMRYRCSTHSYTDNYSCTGHGIDEADLIGAVLEAIQLYARMAVRLDRINSVRQEHSKREKKSVGKRLIALQNEKLRLDSRLQELYEGFVGGDLSRENYLIQKSSITGREQEIAAETSRLEKSLAENSAEQSEAITRYIGYAEVDELTDEMLDELVKRINIYPGDVIEVQLNFTDELERLQEQLNIVA